MIHTSFSLKTINPAPAESESRPRRASFFSRLLAMLYHSRRLQAECVLRRHAHLFEKAGQPLDLTKLGDR